MGSWDRQEKYVDKNGDEIKAGMTITYRELYMDNPQLHFVFEMDGELWGRIVQDEYGNNISDDPPVALRFYQKTAANDGVCYDAEIFH